MCNLSHSNELEEITPFLLRVSSPPAPPPPESASSHRRKKHCDVNRSFVMKKSKEEILADSQNE